MPCLQLAPRWFGCAFPPLRVQGYQYSWCVDPLDGTKEFLKRNGQFTVNIALLRVCAGYAEAHAGGMQKPMPKVLGLHDTFLPGRGSRPVALQNAPCLHMASCCCRVQIRCHLTLLCRAANPCWAWWRCLWM